MAGPFDPSVRAALAPARRPVGVVIGAGVVSALALIAQAFAVAKLIIAVIAGDPVTGWMVAVGGLIALRAGCGWLSDLASARAASAVGTSVRRRVLARALADDSGPGDSGVSEGAVVALATRGAASVEPYLTRYVPAVVLAVLLPPLVLVAIATQDLWSALVIVLTLPLIPIFGILVGLTTRDEAEGQWRAMSDLAGHFLDVMRGLPTLVAYRRAPRQAEVIGAVTETYRVRTMRTLKIAFASSAVLELVATLSVALVAVMVGLRLASGGVSLEVALPVLLLAPEAYWPLRRVGAEFHAAAEGVAVFEQLGAEPPALPAAGRGHSVVVELDAVSVTYPGRRVPALATISLSVAGPGITALVGPSGGGKSTLLSVIAGVLTPSAGVARTPAPDQIAWLPQRPVFVAGTVAENLRLAAPEAPEAELRRVLDRVGLADRLPDLAAELDEDGLGLSAGERARVALARVLLADRPWILLDEPTAHLDAATEQLIVDAVRELGRSRTVLVVAHRPALVELADRVVEVRPAGAETGSRPEPAAGELAAPAQVVPEPTAAPQDGAPQARVGRGWSWILEGLAATSGVALTATAGWLIVKASTQPGVLMLMVAIVGVRTFGIARPVLRYAERLVSHDRAFRLLGAERVAIFRALVPLVPSGLSGRPGARGPRRGELLASVVDDVDVVLDRELRVRVPVRGFALMAVIATGVTTLIDLKAGLVVAVLTVVVGTLVHRIAKTGAARAEVRAVEARALISDRVTDLVQAGDELRRWQAVGSRLDRVDQASEVASSALALSARWLAAARVLSLVAAGVGVVTVAALVAAGSINHAAPVIALLILIPLALAEPLGSLAEAGAAAARVDAAQARLDALVNQPPAVSEPASPVALTGNEIRVDHPGVTRAGRTVLADLDLTVPAGSTLVVRGPSGSGKSTLAALLLRFLEPTTGRVAIGGTDLREASGDDVRARVGWVDDDPHIFASTVAENVRFARPGASDTEVAQALAAAHLGEWLTALPEGLHTRLGDGYAEVSGGERTRIAIARTLLAGHEIVVLDEATAHLDSVSAARITTEIARQVEAEGRTLVWIGHDSYPAGGQVVELSSR